jgi:hypothetical protein
MKTKAFDPQTYEISIRRVVEDGEVLFKGTVRELPDVAVYEETYKDAYDGVVCVIKELHRQAVEQGRPFPQPAQAEEEFSGRVTLRLTKTVHRHAAIAAAREGVSLNHFISTVVATHVGALFGTYPSQAPALMGAVHTTFERARLLCNTTTRLFLGQESRHPEETSLLGKEIIDLLGTGNVRVRTHEIFSTVKTTQPRLLPSETSNTH